MPATRSPKKRLGYTGFFICASIAKAPAHARSMQGGGKNGSEAPWNAPTLRPECFSRAGALRCRTVLAGAGPSNPAVDDLAAVTAAACGLFAAGLLGTCAAFSSTLSGLVLLTLLGFAGG